METPDDILHYIKCKYTESYIHYYKGIVPENLCNKLINQNFNYKPSTYSTHQGKQELKEQVTILAKNYIEEFNNMNEMYAFIDNMNMIKAPNQAWEVDPSDVELKNFVNTAEQTAQETFNARYRDDISTATYANEKMKMDEAMLKSMFG